MDTVSLSSSSEELFNLGYQDLEYYDNSIIAFILQADDVLFNIASLGAENHLFRAADKYQISSLTNNRVASHRTPWFFRDPHNDTGLDCSQKYAYKISISFGHWEVHKVDSSTHSELVTHCC